MCRLRYLIHIFGWGYSSVLLDRPVPYNTARVGMETANSRNSSWKIFKIETSTSKWTQSYRFCQQGWIYVLLFVECCVKWNWVFSTSEVVKARHLQRHELTMSFVPVWLCHMPRPCPKAMLPMFNLVDTALKHIMNRYHKLACPC